MSAPILTKPQFVETLPAAQRAALAPRKSELKEAAEAFVKQLLNHREQWALAAKHVTSTSSIYEAFREAGCEVRNVQARDTESGEPLTEKRKDSKGQDKEYPVMDVYVMLPKGEIRNRSGRQPWVPPTKRLEALREEYSARETTPERRKEIEELVATILERNPKLNGYAGWKTA